MTSISFVHVDIGWFIGVVELMFALLQVALVGSVLQLATVGGGSR